MELTEKSELSILRAAHARWEALVYRAFDKDPVTGKTSLFVCDCLYGAYKAAFNQNPPDWVMQIPALAECGGFRISYLNAVHYIEPDYQRHPDQLEARRRLWQLIINTAEFRVFMREAEERRDERNA